MHVVTDADPRQEWKAYYRTEYPAWWTIRAAALGWSQYDEALIRLLDARPGERVLECGIGTGERYALRLAPVGVRLVGIDLAETLLAVCAGKSAAAGVDIRLGQGDIEALPFHDASFDRVYCFSSLWYVPRFDAALAEMVRVTKPGGALVFDMLNAVHVTPALATLAAWVKRRMGRSVGRWRPRTPWSIQRALRRLKLSWRLEGFGVVAPTSLPLLGERANLAGRIRLLDTGLRRSPARYLGAKLVYVCRRAADGAGTRDVA